MQSMQKSNFYVVVSADGFAYRLEKPHCVASLASNTGKTFRGICTSCWSEAKIRLDGNLNFFLYQQNFNFLQDCQNCFTG